jgi:hypothetical protein
MIPKEEVEALGFSEGRVNILNGVSAPGAWSGKSRTKYADAKALLPIKRRASPA